MAGRFSSEPSVATEAGDQRIYLRPTFSLRHTLVREMEQSVRATLNCGSKTRASGEEIAQASENALLTTPMVYGIPPTAAIL
jgi:hypothetical protein